MNEKFGFLSNFTGIKVIPVKKKTPVYVTPKRGELTDNPPAKDPLLTDDESEEEEVSDKSRPSQLKVPAIINRILESSGSSSLYANEPDPDKTYCSELEVSKNAESVRKSNSEPLFRSNESKLQSSHDELCSRMSEIYLKQKKPTPPLRNEVRETVAGPFSDDSEEEDSKKLVDTVLHSSSSDESGSEQPKLSLPRPAPNRKQLIPKPSLPDTIVGFSDSMSELTIHEEVAAPVQTVSQEAQEETDSDYEVITVLDSEEEIDDDVSEINDNDQPPMLPTNDSFQNCSSLVSSHPKASTESDNTVNRFFNNPPSASPDRVVSHSIIQRYREQPIINIPSPIKENPSNMSADRFKAVIDEERSDESINDDFELVQTDTSDVQLIPEAEDHSEPIASPEVEENHSEPIASSPEIVESQEVVPSQRTPESSSSESEDESQTIRQGTSNQTSFGNINISAQINIKLKLNIVVEDPNASSEEDSSSSDSQPSPPKRTPRKTATKDSPKVVSLNKKGDSVRKEKRTMKPGSASKTTPKAPQDDFQTPSKAVEVIDEDLQKILDSLYGETWKTPQLLRSCKSKTVRQDLRKSIHSNNFENFVKNLPKDLESTRIGGASSSDESSRNKKLESAGETKDREFATPKDPKRTPSSTQKKPSSSVKKTPSTSSKNTPVKTTTPRYLAICDSDTPSEDDSSSDEDFNPNETWNASSDEEYEDEAERIKKRSIARKSRHNEEIIFIPDNSAEDKQKKLDDLLERYEYKKPPGMQGTGTKPPMKQPSKRKLFTHSHYEDDFNLDSTPDDDDERRVRAKEKENDENTVNLPGIFFPRPLPVSKKDTAKKLEEPPLPTAVKRTPKSKVQTPKSTSKPLENNKFAAYSFLKSLDVEVNSVLCNADALFFRNNYKTKRTELTDKLFKLYDEKVFDGQLSEVPVKWNKKLLNTAGRCNNSRRGGVRQSQLELSEKVLTSADRLRCTLIHEMCHAATWIIQGENGHGATWKRWAAKANKTFPELPKINVCHDYVIEYRYTYQCTNCKAKYQTHSKSKKVENIRCSICRGSIELFLNKKNKNGEVVMTPVSRDVKGFPKYVQINYKDVKKPNMTHKEVMQVLSQQFGALSVEEKQNI